MKKVVCSAANSGLLRASITCDKLPISTYIVVLIIVRVELNESFNNSSHMLEEKNTELDQRGRMLRERDKELDKALNLINTMQNSLSWKITAPLRKALGLIRR